MQYFVISPFLIPATHFSQKKFRHRRQTAASPGHTA
jgi:hypothetical protein